MIAAEARRMLHRRSRATAVAALVLLLGGMVSACGFDAPTDRVNDIAAGTNDRSAEVDLLGLRVLSSEAGEGRLIGSLANNTADDAGVRAVSGEGITVEGLEDDLVVPANGRVNLAAADTAPIHLSGDFAAGEFVTLDITVFGGSEETLTLDVAVVKNCHQYTQVPEPPAPAETETADENAETEAADEHAEGEPEVADEHAETEGEHVEDARYICDHPTGDTGH